MTDKTKIRLLSALVVVLLFAVVGLLAGRNAAPEPSPVIAAAVTATPRPAATSAPQDYVLNNNTKRFHYPDCASAAQILEKNREDVFASRDELIDRGFKPCGNCNP